MENASRVVLDEDLDAIFFLESAGGVHSPAPSGDSQSRVYRPLRLPTILVGDSNLGGISTTLTSYESLLIQGYDVPLILMFENPQYKNDEIVRLNVNSDSVKVVTIPRPPERPKKDDPIRDATNLMVFYSAAAVEGQMAEAVAHLKSWHKKRIGRLEALGKRAEDVVWWPFTQHASVKKTTVIDSAFGDRFSCFDASTKPATSGNLFDGCASWWTQIVGHAHPRLVMAATRAAARYGHVMFPECAHEPAIALAEKLTETAGKGWGSRVFYSDDGSTAIEVALKMAFRQAEVTRGSADAIEGNKIEVIGIDGGYHGDTIGAMNACSPNVYNSKVQWYKPQGLWFSPPTVTCKDGVYKIRLPAELESNDITEKQLEFASLANLISPTDRDPNNDADTASLAKSYRSYIEKILSDARSQGRAFGAVLLEPLLMGAGGMILVDPLFQRTLIDIVRSGELFPPLPVIYDEVFTGFHRLGHFGHASIGVDVLNRYPDIACFAKALTGGLVPMAVTLATEKVFDMFKADSKVEALLHGHSYTAHPIGCAVALESLKMFEDFKGNKDIWNEEKVKQLSHLPSVDGVISMGTVLAIELKAVQKGYASTSVSASLCQRIREEHSIFARPLGNVVYVMGSLNTTEHDSNNILDGLLTELKETK
ncbi:hypothetical protein HDU97_007690 [Phlyctochytrium planicorne]|nr:hypothetical protein HDU97_007690 [Phlyctochytrium planicorne]